MEPELWQALYALVRLGAHRKAVETDTVRLGKMLGVSQQTASRRIRQLVSAGLIAREVTKAGQLISLTEKGVDALREVYLELKGVFEEAPGHLALAGEVFTGLGEGSYYVELPGYKKQFVSKLGFIPYPGTLNLRLKGSADVMNKRALEKMPGILIKGFFDERRTYGDVKCFRALVNDSVEGAVLLIKRTHYGEDVIEVISKEYLRQRLNLRDGDLVNVKVFLE